MANTMTIQEVLAVFERFSEEVCLERLIIMFGGETRVCWGLCLNRELTEARLAGIIKYFKDTPGRIDQIIEVELLLDAQHVFRCHLPADASEVREFVEHMDAPLRDEWSRPTEQRKADAAERLRGLLQ